MITLQEFPNDNLVELHASGKMTRAEYRDLLPRLDRRLRESPPVRCYIELHDFHGWELAALWDELKFDLQHRRDLGRVAVVGETRMEQWGTNLSRLFFASAVRYFDHAQAAEARAWVVEPVPAEAGATS